MGTSRRAALALAVLALGASVSACDSGAKAYPPTGIDQLTIPTPSPDPSDFVARIDNRWFPAAPGDRWVYRVPDAPGRTTVTAAAGPTLDGVRTTSLRTVSTTDAQGARPVRTTDYFAQDRAGNVWWFGRAGEWQVGPGVGAGLMMAAHPRRGDGYWMASAGSVRVHGVVVDTGRTWEASLGSTHDAVVIEVIRDGVADVEIFAPGIGMVRKGETGLASYRQPRP